jgi:hypothetical protein
MRKELRRLLKDFDSANVKGQLRREEKAATMREVLSEIRDIAAESCNDPGCQCTAGRILAICERELASANA